MHVEAGLEYIDDLYNKIVDSKIDKSKEKINVISY